MSENINLAVILAAGMGSRLDELKMNKPKGLITLGELPVIYLLIFKTNLVYERLLSSNVLK